MKRIAHVVLNSGIGDGRLLKYGKSCQDFGLECEIFCLNSETNSVKKFSIDGVKYVACPSPKFEMAKRGLWHKDVTQRDYDYFTYQAAFNISTEILKFEPHIIHSHDMFGLSTGAYLQRILSLKAKSCFWIHDLHEYTRGSTNIPQNVHNTAVAQHEEFIKEPDALISVSGSISKTLVREDNLTSTPEVVLNCPTLKVKKCVSIKKKLGLKNNEILGVYSGSINSKMRGVETLIDALPLMPGVHIAIVHNNKDIFSKLLHKSIQLGVSERLHEHPFVSPDSISCFLSDADIAVHPMLKYPNGDVALPNKLFEYLHAKLPTLVSDVSSMSKFVKKHKIGEIFKSGSPESLAEKFFDLNEKTKITSSNFTDSLLAKYSWEAQEKKILKVYNSFFMNPRGLRIAQGFSQNANQPAILAKSLRKKHLDAKSVQIYESKTKYYTAVDLKYSYTKFPYFKNSHFLTSLKRLSFRFDVFHFHAYPLFYNKHLNHPHLMQDLKLLKDMGKTVIFHFRGSEARDIKLFSKTNTFSWYTKNDIKDFDSKKHKQFINDISKIADRTFVTDPELLQYSTSSEIVPRAIDLDTVNHKKCNNRRNTNLRVIHAPTNETVKGTKEILQHIEFLKNKGITFDFKLITGLSNTDLLKEIRNSDIVIDQMKIGWFGVLSVEAMATGTPVVCYLNDHFKDNKFFPTCIMNSTIEKLDQDLETLLKYENERERLSQLAKTYAAEHHDSDKIAAKLAGVYQECATNKVDIDDDKAFLKLVSDTSLPPQEFVPVRWIEVTKNRLKLTLKTNFPKLSHWLMKVRSTINAL